MRNGTAFNYAANYFLIELSEEIVIEDFFERFYLRLDTRAFAFYEFGTQVEIKEVYKLRPTHTQLEILPHSIWKQDTGLQLLKHEGVKI